MERHAFAMKVKDGQMNTYRRKLGEIWLELTGFLDRNQIKNFSIWNADQLIFGYYEKADGAVLNVEEEVSKGQTDRGNPGYFSVDFYSGRGYASDVS